MQNRGHLGSLPERGEGCQVPEQRGHLKTGAASTKSAEAATGQVVCVGSLP